MYFFHPRLAYYMGPLRSVSCHTIWGPLRLSDHFHCLLYGAPLRSVSLHAIGGPPQLLVFFNKIYGAPLRSVSPLTIWSPLRLVSFLTIWGPVRSVSLHTFWGSPEIIFFSYYIRAPSDQFLRLLIYMGAPLDQLFFHTI